MAKEDAILNKILAGHDAGYFDLPAEFLARRAAEAKIAVALRSLDEDMKVVQPATVRSTLVRDVIEAAGNGGVPDDFAAPFLESQDTLRKLSAEHAILAEAKEELIERTPWLAMRMSEEILANCLRPAMESVLDGLRSRSDLVSLVPWGDTRALIRASEEVREYHELVATAATHYQAIRDAQWRLKALTGSPSEEAWFNFGQLRNMPVIWPGRGAWTDRFRGKSPWPEDPLAYMAWLVASEAEPWLPTAAECEAAQAEHLSGVTALRTAAR